MPYMGIPLILFPSADIQYYCSKHVIFVYFYENVKMSGYKLADGGGNPGSRTLFLPGVHGKFQLFLVLLYKITPQAFFLGDKLAVLAHHPEFFVH